MLRKVLTVMLVIGMCFVAGNSYADDEKNFIDVIKKPFEFILKPLGAEGLGGAVLHPVKSVAEPVFNLGGEVVTPTGFDKEEVDYPGFVSVITREDIDWSYWLMIKDFVEDKMEDQDLDELYQLHKEVQRHHEKFKKHNKSKYWYPSKVDKQEVSEESSTDDRRQDDDRPCD